MDTSSPVYATVGAITAAIIAGSISFLIAVLSKDQKTSEFRQAWIDGLRSEIAELISVFSVISDMIRVMLKSGKTKEEITDYLFQKDEHFHKLEMLDARIKLRLNPDEHHLLLAALMSLRKYFKSGDFLDSDFATTLVENVVKESRIVLKYEWGRVKRGEPAFFMTKYISFLILIIASILWIAYARNHLNIEWLS